MEPLSVPTDRHPIHHRYFPHVRWTALVLAIPVLLIGVATLAVTPTPDTSAIGHSTLTVGEELTIHFNVPISRQVAITLEPNIEGELTYADPLVGGQLYQTAIFRPTVSWQADTVYRVSLANVKPAYPTLRSAATHEFSFATEPLPVIEVVTPDVESELRPAARWSITFDKPFARLAEYEVQFEPAIEFSTAVSEDGRTLHIIGESLLGQGREYAMTVLERERRTLRGSAETVSLAEPIVKRELIYRVAEAPGIAAVTPSGGRVGLADPVSVTFTEPVEAEQFLQHVSLEPAVEGEWIQEAQQKLVLLGGALTQDTAYTLTIDAGLRSSAGGIFEEASVHTFRTKGPVKVASSTPSANTQGATVSSVIRVTFDQAVDQASAEARFAMAPEKEGSFSWDGNTLVFTPSSSFDFNTTYTVTLASGIKATDGFVSDQEYRIPFTTELSIVKLGVPFHRQQHNLSCEVATLVMALRYHGVSIEEQPLIDFIGFDPTPKANGVWGNPHAAFVGDIDGRQPSTGYGVYWEPIARAAQQYRTARSFTGGSIETLTAEIDKGHPVIIWGTAGSGSRIDWKTPSGDNVTAINGEHTYIVIGYVGSRSAPTKIITLDPLSGERHFTTSSFLWNWGLLNRSGVVVE